ncbi:hypothetical protein LCGC14_2573760, partial [marine sediment metagenome]
MKKLLIALFIIVGLSVSGFAIAAEFTNTNLLKLSGGYISNKGGGWDWGASGDRLGKIWGTDADFNGTLTAATTIMSGSLTMDDNILLAWGTGADIVSLNRSTSLSADAELANVIVGTSDHQGVAANSFILSNITADGDMLFLVRDGTDSKEFLLANADSADLQMGHGMATMTLKTASGDLTLNPAGDIVVGSNKITGLADATELADAVNLSTLLANTGLTFKYWLGNQTLDFTLTDSEAALQETPSTDPETLSTIFFVATVADTEAPFTVGVGTIVDAHFDAKVTSTAGKHDEQLKVQLGYVDADGSSNFVQIGVDSDLTAILTAVQTHYELHLHVTTEITVPAGKRLYLRFIADATLSGGSYPEINVYYDNAEHHVDFVVSASILENYLL